VCTLPNAGFVGPTRVHNPNDISIDSVNFGRPFVKTVRLMLSDRCPVCLSSLSCLFALPVTLVYCGQTVGWIKMKLGMEVGLGPGHIVLDGDPVPAKGHSP